MKQLLSKQALISALGERRKPENANILCISLGLIIFVLIAIGIALYIAPHYRLNFHFRKETGLITVLSTIFLGMAAGLSIIAYILRRPNAGYFALFWLVAAFGLSFLAIDELMSLHESFGKWMKHTSLGPTHNFRNWNDVIVISYGILTIPVALAFITEILRPYRFAELCSVAFSFYLIHTIIDSTQTRSTWSVIFEESAKLFCSAFLALSMLVAVLGIIAALHPKSSS